MASHTNRAAKRVVERTANDIIERVGKGLQAQMENQQEQIDLLTTQLAESHLRLRFVMDHFKFERTVPSQIIGAPAEITTATLYDLYLHQREAFMERMLAETESDHASGTPAPADAGPEASNPDHEPGLALYPRRVN